MREQLASAPSAPRPRVRSSRGFTLIEIMIAVMIFSVGMMAVLMLQFGAIEAYSSARDQSISADVAQRAESLFRLEVKRATQATPLVNVNSPFVTQSFEQALTTAPWIWAPLTVRPVDERMIRTSNGRYCVFARGDYLSTALDTVTRQTNTGPAQLADLMRAHVAVVYPASNRTLKPNATCDESLFATFGCPGSLQALLNPGLRAGLDATLDECGLRAVYSSMIVKL